MCASFSFRDRCPATSVSYIRTLSSTAKATPKTTFDLLLSMAHNLGNESMSVLQICAGRLAHDTVSLSNSHWNIDA